MIKVLTWSTQMIMQIKEFRIDIRANIVKYLTPSLGGWLKWNTDASRIDVKQSIIIGNL